MRRQKPGAGGGIAMLGSARSHQTSLLQLHAKGNLALTDRMNFWIFFKQPLNPPGPLIWEIYCEVLQRVGLQVSAQHVVIQQVCCMLSKTFSKFRFSNSTDLGLGNLSLCWTYKLNIDIACLLSSRQRVVKGYFCLLQ